MFCWIGPQAADGASAADILGRPVVDGGSDESSVSVDAVDGIDFQEETVHSTEFYFNLTSEVLRTMHRDRYVIDESPSPITGSSCPAVSIIQSSSEK